MLECSPTSTGYLGPMPILIWSLQNILNMGILADSLTLRTLEMKLVDTGCFTV